MPSAVSIEAELRAELAQTSAAAQQQQQRTAEEQSEHESICSRASGPAFPYVLQYLEASEVAMLHELSPAGDVIVASAQLPGNAERDWSVSTDDFENYYLSSESMAVSSWVAWLQRL